MSWSFTKDQIGLAVDINNGYSKGFDYLNTVNNWAALGMSLTNGVVKVGQVVMKVPGWVGVVSSVLSVVGIDPYAKYKDQAQILALAKGGCSQNSACASVRIEGTKAAGSSKVGGIVVIYYDKDGKEIGRDTTFSENSFTDDTFNPSALDRVNSTARQATPTQTQQSSSGQQPSQ